MNCGASHLSLISGGAECCFLFYAGEAPSGESDTELHSRPRNINDVSGKKQKD